MKKTAYLLAGLLISFGFGFYVSPANTKSQKNNKQSTKEEKTENMKLGAFSISLNVKDLKASKEFYEALGFSSMGGDMKYNYLIMKNGNAIIGLFQGMFEGNILTFNPGWDENAKNFDPFDDVREIQKHLKSKGIKLTTEADETKSGPGSVTLTDPDGNVILLDQHR
jgi:predicted enzyme related to lactoylglutathione lyase